MNTPLLFVSPGRCLKAEELKKKGNEAMKAGQLVEAVKFYTDAINLHPDNHILYSNRCAAFMKQEKFNEAVEDANTTVRIKPDWAKVTTTVVGQYISIHIYYEQFALLSADSTVLLMFSGALLHTHTH